MVAYFPQIVDYHQYKVLIIHFSRIFDINDFLDVIKIGFVDVQLSLCHGYWYYEFVPRR